MKQGLFLPILVLIVIALIGLYLVIPKFTYFHPSGPKYIIKVHRPYKSHDRAQKDDKEDKMVGKIISGQLPTECDNSNWENVIPVKDHGTPDIFTSDGEIQDRYKKIVEDYFLHKSSEGIAPQEVIAVMKKRWQENAKKCSDSLTKGTWDTLN